MKKYLLIALAALGFAACADPQDDINNPALGGEVEESFIAINLMSADVETRAVTDDPYGDADKYGYEEGTVAERAIKTAYFFFFDENGNPFNVVGAPATAPGGSVNHLSLTISEATTSGMPNVSDIKEAVLVLNTYKGIYPKQIVAVLNWIPNSDKAYSLQDLHNSVPITTTIKDNEEDKTYYVMSNSVYMDDAGKVVDATPLTAANIKTDADAAKAAPVEIYVERTAAKVVLTAGGKVANTENIFDTQKDSNFVLGSPSADVYVKLHGWELYNDYAESYLLKTIDPTWTAGDLGLTWNDIPYYRSYWAESQSVDPNDAFSWKYTNHTAKGFPTEYGYKVASAADYADGTYTYCGENTGSYRTKVILKGQLMQKNGENYDSLELARWYGNEYAGNEALRIAVANSLKYTLYYKPEPGVENYVSIAPEDLVCVEGTTVDAEAYESYEVVFQLSDAGEDKTWYQYSSEKGYTIFGNSSVAGDNTAQTNAHLATVEPALLYANGQTYYFVDIQHLGAVGKPAEFGVVRNHVYQIDINKIEGYGSPVYIGTSDLEDPEYPEIEDEASYVAARINVLSWKVVKQGVNVGQ